MPPLFHRLLFYCCIPCSFLGCDEADQKIAQLIYEQKKQLAINKAHFSSTEKRENRSATIDVDAPWNDSNLELVDVLLQAAEYLRNENNPLQAVELLRHHSLRNHPLALCFLGKIYERGLGVIKSRDKALDYYLRAAEQHEPHAQYYLGLFYANGIEVEQSYVKAYFYYEKSALQGYAPAQFGLGSLYENGFGIEKSREKSVNYYQKAAEQGYLPALVELENARQKEPTLSYQSDEMEKKEATVQGIALHHFSDRARQIIQEKQREAELLSDSTEGIKSNKWLNALSKIPFGTYIQPQVGKTAKEIVEETSRLLNEAIYGQDRAKQMVLEMVGQWIQKKQMKGGVIGIQGYPGTGKTVLISKGLSKALNRPLSFISLGGQSDSHFLAGSDESYICSHHGKIVEALIESQCMNPIIYFDELDKVSFQEKGSDIMNILTHITDPSQQTHFQDRYFRDINIDLSQILFVFSYNDESLIPTPLKERMTIIRTQIPSKQDKLVIARQHLIPAIWDEVGLGENDILIDDDALEEIIEEYTHEVGVRGLKQKLFTIARRVNLAQLLAQIPSASPFRITKEQLAHFLGEPELPFKEGNWQEFYAYRLQRTPIKEVQKGIVQNKIASSLLSDSEGQHARKWLDSFFQIPFGRYSGDRLPQSSQEIQHYLHQGQQALENAVFGHDKAKQLLLGVIGEWISSQQHKGLILGLQGPPGNGKTLFALHGLKNVLQRPAYLISLGGSAYGATLVGHDASFVGAHFGHLVRALIETDCMNPIIVFDELDKVSKTAQGEEIINTLIHLTDVTQNHQFQDHYFSGIHIDLSQAVFVFSFNDISSIDPILLNRMTITKTGGLNKEEKILITQRHLLPQIFQDLSLNEEHFLFPESAIAFLIDHYTDEKGARELKRHLTTILRKINLVRLQYPQQWVVPVTIDQAMIEAALD